MTTNADDILDELTTRQHLTPGRTLKEIVAETVASTGVCASAADRALVWLKLPADRPIGRLRRSELIQLARSMHRFWTEVRAGEARTSDGRLPDAPAVGRAVPSPRTE
jgi:hypothetical protein